MLTFLLIACDTSTLSAPLEPTFIRVEITSGELGSKDLPLDFSAIPQSRSVRVTTEDRDGDPYPFNGELTVNIRTGRLEQPRNLETVSEGLWEGDVTFAAAFGPARIWFSDEGDAPGTTEREPSFATGVSEPIWFQIPTLAEINEVEDGTTNQLAGEFAEIRAADRDIRVTAVGTNGYWVSDLLGDDTDYAHMFVYTFSAPDPWVEVGQRIDLLTGSDQDYLGTTQLAFPHYTVADDPVVETPSAVTLSEALCGNDAELEKIESSLVRLDNVFIPSGFVSGTADYEDYIDYGQWPISFGPSGSNCSFYVDSTIAVPSFDPREYAGAELTSVQGMLFQIFSQWILLIRGVEDLPLAANMESSEEPSGKGPARPQAREIPTLQEKLR
jgi:hypothetical protein